MNRKPFKASDGPMLMLIAVGAMIAGQLVIGILLGGVESFIGNIPAIMEIVNYIGMMLFQGIYLGTFFLYTSKRKIACDYNPLKKLSPWSVAVAPFLALICLLSFMGPANLFDKLLSEIGFSLDAIGGSLEVSTPMSMVFLAFDTCIAAPICEELIFRVGLLSGVNKAEHNAIKMSAISGICFALMHINPAQTVYQFCLGMAIAYVVIKTGSALPGMIMHATSNALALVLSFTGIGTSLDGFYMKVGSNLWITLLLCVALPVVAVVIVWLVAKYLNRTEQKHHPEKFVRRKVIWIDETTYEPIFEGEEAPVLTEENRIVQKGFSPMTGAPVIVDRAELQTVLIEDYYRKEEKSGRLGKNSYRMAFVIYFIVTGLMWLFTLGSGILLNSLHVLY